ncbi:M949_RS01915 family surface polysaccharide biosynthesis protein [Arcicella aurantiaca]|nr:hypothetical protein [Arcicella aurantiaca]
MKQNNKPYFKLFFAITVLFSTNLLGQTPIKSTKLDVNKLPYFIKVDGKAQNAVRWTDNLGDNIVVTSETGRYTPKKAKENEIEEANADLFAYHYIITNNQAQQTWKVYDFIKDCPLDIEANYVKNTFQVTDLDKNGVAEVWLMYRTVCHGDVSPSDMKIIMYQGQQKYAMRGRAKIKYGEKEFEGGEYKLDPAFNKAPKVIIDFAKKLWNKNILQTFE